MSFFFMKASSPKKSSTTTKWTKLAPFSFLCLFFLASLRVAKSQIPEIIVDEVLDEGTFSGQALAGVPQGEGTLIYRSNDPAGRANYTGGFENGVLSGNGTMHWINGARYTGEIRDSLFHGMGEYTWPNGDFYVGQYNRGRRNGIGDMIYADGDTYRGKFRDGKYHGQGEYRWKEGNIYVGDWQDGVAHGHGEFTYASGPRSGERYQGAFENGLKHGYGTYYYPDGKSFVGNYRNGLRNGAGTIYFTLDGSRKREGIWLDGELVSSSATTSTRGSISDDQVQDGFDLEITLRNGVYRGGVQDGVPHGIGSIQYFDMDLQEENVKNYTGEWKFGKKSGFGTMFWWSGDSYTGDWFDDLPHGNGEYNWRAGHRYTGDYRFGAPDGRGVFETARGDIYQGEFERGLPNGQGEFFYGSGDRRLDRYVGQFVDGAFSGKGRYFFANGDRFEGDFSNGERNGYGIISYSSGGRREGVWSNDRLVGEVLYQKPDGTVVTENWQQPRSALDGSSVGGGFVFTRQSSASSSPRYRRRSGRKLYPNSRVEHQRL